MKKILHSIIIRKRKYWTYKNYKNNTFAVYLNWNIFNEYKIKNKLYTELYLKIKIDNPEYEKDMDFLSKNLITMVTFIEEKNVLGRIYHVYAFYFLIKPENIDEFKKRNFDISKLIILNNNLEDKNIKLFLPLLCNLNQEDPVITEKQLSNYKNDLNNIYVYNLFMDIIKQKKYQQKIGIFITVSNNISKELQNKSKGIFINLNNMISENYESLMGLYKIYTKDTKPNQFFIVQTFYLNYYHEY